VENIHGQSVAKPRTVKNHTDGRGPYKKPKYVFVQNKHGRRYCYFRRAGSDLVPLPNLPFDHPDFLSAYVNAAQRSGVSMAKSAEFTEARDAAAAGMIADSLIFAMKKARDRAVERDLAFNLTPESVRELFAAQGGTCAMTGLAFAPSNETESRRNPFCPSIDRVDLTLGYIKGNVRIVTCIANVARSDFGDAAFYKMCAAGAEKVRERGG
jgi:hypothetical protein